MPSGPATLQLTTIPAGLHLKAWGDGADECLEKAPEWLGLHDDARSFVPESRRLRMLQLKFAGVRFGRTSALMERLIPVIIGQKVTAAGARRSWFQLLNAYGEPAPGPAPLTLPPAPETLAALGSSHLVGFHIEPRRGRTIIAACRRAAALSGLASLPAEAATEALLALPGIGPWTATMTVASVHGDPDVVTLGDYHLPNSVAWALAREPRADDARMLELLEPYRPHRGRVVRWLVLAGIHAPRYGPRQPIRHLR